MRTPDSRSTCGSDRTNASAATTRPSRGIAPVAGVLVIALTVGLAATAAGAVLAIGDVTDDRSPQAALSLSADGETLTFTHRGGDALDVRRLDLEVVVDGDPLADQPPVPFFSASGFRSGPTGPFNSATDPQWSAGETATLSVAGTNRPVFETGDEVTVRVYAGDALIADLSTTLS